MEGIFKNNLSEAFKERYKNLSSDILSSIGNYPEGTYFQSLIVKGKISYKEWKICRDEAVASILKERGK